MVRLLLGNVPIILPIFYVGTTKGEAVYCAAEGKILELTKNKRLVGKAFVFARGEGKLDSVV